MKTTFLWIRKLQRRSTPVDWAVALLALLIPVGLAVTINPAETRVESVRLLGGMLLFYAIVQAVTTKARLGWLAAGAVAVGDLLAGVSLVSVLWVTTKLPFIPAEVYERFTPLVTDTVNPNVMAGYLVLFLPLSLAFGLWLRGGPRVAAWLAALPVLAILLLTQSRGALLALGVSMLALLALRWRRGWLLLALGGLAAVAALMVAPDAILTRLTAGQLVSGLEGRVQVWLRGLYIVQDFPLTGIGMGSFGPLVDRFYPLFLYEPGKVSHAHNLLLQVAVDMGLPGLLAWLGIFSGLSLACWRVYRRAGRTPDGAWLQALAAGLLAAQSALVVHGMTDAVTWGQVKAAPLVWLVWGLAAAANNLQIGGGDG